MQEFAIKQSETGPARININNAPEIPQSVYLPLPQNSTGKMGTLFCSSKILCFLFQN